MSRTLKVTFGCAWIIVGTIFYAMIWSHHPDYFPDFPEWAGLAVSKLMPSSDAETVQVTYILVLSFFSVCFFSAIVFLLSRCFKRKAA